MNPVRLGLIGDIHAQMGRLDQVLDHLAAGPRLTGVLLVGDVSRDPPWMLRGQRDDDQRASFASVVDHITARLGCPVLFVPGNHDPRDIPLPGNVDGRLQQLESIRIFGIGGAGPARFGFPYEWSEAQIEALEVPSCDLLLVHCPPFGTPIDALDHGRGHAGSRAIRAIAERHPGVLVCGHIHEAAGFATLGDCLCVNVGALGEPYGRACVGELVVTVDPEGLRWQVVLTELATGSVREASHPIARPS